MFGFFYSVLYPIKFFAGGINPLAKTTTGKILKTTTDGKLKTMTKF